MKVGSLFSGYGGLDMAVGGDLAWYSEIEPAACKVLEQLHPDVPNIGDITAVDWSQVEPVDVITGGYPCQPFSHAGLRKGKNDERHLWPYVRDAIRAIRPRYAILENVRGHLTLGFADVLADLAGMGWDARWGVVRASDAGAPHGRARLFIVAYPARGTRGEGQGWGLPESERPTGLATRAGISTDTINSGFTLSGHSDGGAQTERQGHDGQSLSALTANASDNGLELTSIGLESQQGKAATQRHSSHAADTDGDGHGEQLHARGMGGLEGQTESRPQQRQRTRRKSDARGADDAANANVPSGEAPNDGRPRDGYAGRLKSVERGRTNWGHYAPAIKRWEPIIGRGAPAPTVRRGERERLNPVFVEWMMGLPKGHVTGHGLSAAQELKMLGNGVVPQQAALALRLLGVR